MIFLKIFILAAFPVCHALLSIILQFPLVKWTKKLDMKAIFMFSYGFYAISS